MAEPLLTTATTLLCAHGGQARALTPQPRVRTAGAPVLAQLPPLAVANCANTVPGPCLTAQFVTAATRVLVSGLPALLQSGVSICSPTGTPLTVLPGQARVRGL